MQRQEPIKTFNRERLNKNQLRATKDVCGNLPARARIPIP